MNLQAENIPNATPVRPLKAKGLVKPLQNQAQNKQVVQNATEKQTETKKKDVEPVERATSAKFLEDEWERMHADPLIDFSNIRPPSAEMCWPLSHVRVKRAMNDFGGFPVTKSSQQMSPQRDADNSFDIDDL